MRTAISRQPRRAVAAVGAVLALAAVTVASSGDAASLCGNGAVEAPEQCDDGNLLPGDGCSPICTVEVAGNLPPDCADAEASVSELWPPNHRLEPVRVLGVADPDRDPVQLTITAIAQDEPVLGTGSGDTCPDAEGIDTETALVRVERAGAGDGRVYRIAFTAHDDRGGVCSGEVSVCVPHDQGRGSACGAGNEVYDSAAPCGPADCDPLACIPDDDLLPSVACAAEALPRKIERLVTRARVLASRAETAPPRRAARLERKAERRLRRAARRADRMGSRKLSPSCAEQLSARLGSAADCVACEVP